MKKTVAVLFGGQSGEHEVSLMSGRAVMLALDPAKYQILPVGIARDGSWIVGNHALDVLLQQADQSRLPAHAQWRHPVEEQELQPSLFSGRYASLAAGRSVTWHPRDLFDAFQVDVVFPALHGPMGEDGTLQGLLDMADIPYVGCGVAASAVGMDKALMRSAFAAHQLPILPWLLVLKHEWNDYPERVYAQIEEALRYPVFVKPANMGSSVGVTRANNRSQLVQSLAEASRYDRRIVVEQGISAREIEVSVLGNDYPRASVPGEVVPSDDWYTYEAKYLSGRSQILIPANLSLELRNEARSLALRAFTAIDGSGLARVDFLLDRETERLWVSEINTMPGFTPISMYAKLWVASDMEYSTLLDRLVELAFERYHRHHGD
ncbi:MAG: D-alanine--D-alanine ligase [Chloroflexaceae bacterium]|nr:D-alanine--D-alanine ligase [Chloroflexaceae bacterium]